LLAAQDKQKADEKAKRDKYTGLIAQADVNFNKQAYAEALVQYKSAAQLQPSEEYPGERIRTINDIMERNQKADAEAKAKKEAYDKAIAQADNLLNAAKYKDAITAYQSAMKILPAETYPQTQIDKIKAIQENDLNFANLVKDADASFNANDLQTAKDQYKKALALKSNDSYCNQQISKIDNLLAAQDKQKADEKAKRDKYIDLIAQADKSFNVANYTLALTGYQQALTLYPNETYPQQRISDIDQKQKQLERDNKYKATIDKADGLFNSANWDEAKSTYNQALAIKPADEYATKKIVEIDKLVAEQERKQAEDRALREKKEAEAKALQDKYNKTIAGADDAYNKADYTTAKSLYTEALTLMPGQVYPQSKLNSIEQILAGQKLEANYKNALTEADKLYANQQLAEAKDKYNQALQLKPNEAYPKGKIDEINAKLKKAEDDKAALDKKKALYDNAIASADKYFDLGKYDNAKTDYEKARDLMPNESYPRQRLAKIKEIKELLAKSDKKETEPVKTGGLSDLKFSTEKELTDYLEDLKKTYPLGVTKEKYSDANRTIIRYVVIRNGVVNDYREVRYNWGTEYFRNGKAVTVQYFNQQVKERQGENLYNKANE
jgi:tetratricopeptide (TPR) repeat protein